MPLRALLDDPEDHIKSAIARYSADTIAESIAIFTSKRVAQTLPPTVDARYLLGIVRNLADKRELLALPTAIVEQRIRWRDHELRSLAPEIGQLQQQHPSPRALLSALALRALSSDRGVDEIFFLDELKKVFLDMPASTHRGELDQLARVVAASFHSTKERRQRVLLAIASVAWPIEQMPRAS